jgi:tetratricopeptide (TPR) repeat protein
VSGIFGRIGAALLLAAACAGLGCGSDDDRVQAALERFEQAVAHNDVPGAVSAVDEVAGLLPDDADSAYKVAHLWIRAGEHARARWVLQDAAQRFPAALDLRITLAEVALALGDASSALAALEAVPEGALQAAGATLLRARAQRDLGDGAASLATLAAAEESFEDWSDFRGLRVEFLIEDQASDEALELVRDARSRADLADEKRTWFAESEASLLAREERFDEAMRIFEELIAADPQNARAWARRMQLLAEQRRFDEACDELDAALAARPDLGFLYDLLASAEAGRGDVAASEAAYRKRVEVVGDATGVERLALFLFEKDRPDEAVEILAVKRGEFSADEARELEYLEVAILLDGGDIEGARTRYEDYRRRHWSDPRAEYLRARLELADGNPSAAAERLNQLLPRFDRSDVQHWYGKALQELGDYAGAEHRFGIALLRNPQQLSSHKALIVLLERRGAWVAVHDAAEHLLHVHPGNPVALAALARSVLRLEPPELAEQILRAYVDHYPTVEDATLGLAASLRALGRTEDALEVLEASRDRFGASISWRAERALTLVALGRSGEAVAELDQPAPDGSAAALHRARAIVLFSSDRGPEAVLEAGRALELEPEERAPLMWVGDYYAQNGEFESAAAAYRRYLASRPADAEAYFHFGVALDRIGETPAAIEAYRRALEIDSDQVGSRNNLALALESTGRRGEALALAQEAYARDDRNPMVLDTLGWLWVGADRGERGVRLLERAHALAPDDPTVSYHLAVGLRETGRIGESRALLEELEARLGPDDVLRVPVTDAIAALGASDAS